MKRYLFIPMLLALAACDVTPQKSDVNDMFQGSHELHKMTSNNGIHGDAHWSGFFLMGSSGDAHLGSDITVTFSWKNNANGIWMVSSLPVSKFRFEFNEDVKRPTVRFRWRPCSYNCDDKTNELIEYVVLTCRERDWPRDVQLPLNKKHSDEQDDGRY